MKYFVLPTLVLLILFMVISTAQAAIELVSFTATPVQGSILLAWETATEFDNAGFFIVRSLAEAGDYTRISPFIPAEGGGVTGAEYEYQDGGVVSGVVYYYKLEAIGNDQSSEFYGPISATLLGPTNTPTATPSSTSTSTRTATSTATNTATQTKMATSTSTTTQSAQLTHTKTPTRTNTPTAPSTQPTSTASRTPTKTPTQNPYYNIQPSRTPFPTLITPTTTATVTQTSSSTPETIPTFTNASEASGLSTPTLKPSPGQNLDNNQIGVDQDSSDGTESGSSRRIGLVILIVVAWGILAVGIYFFIIKPKA